MLLSLSIYLSISLTHTALQKKQEQRSEGEEKLSYHVEQYRPGLKVDRSDKDTEEGVAKEDEGEELVPTPRKRLMNFKIPILNRKDSRRDQNASVVTRRRLFSDEGTVYP